MTKPKQNSAKPNSDLEELKLFAAENIDIALVRQVVNLLNRTETAPEVVGRWQDQIILEELPRGASVLDLGCGDGDLLSKLMRTLEVRGQGVELDPMAVLRSIDRGVPVLNLDVDKGLGDFASQSFDYVILESTLQTLKEPIAVLEEMLRVGRRSIVSFPNFGQWRVRFDLAVRGRMPVTPSLPYGWHNTPNIHLFTLADFWDWCENSRVEVAKAYGLTEGKIHPLSPQDNLTADEALFFLGK